MVYLRKPANKDPSPLTIHIKRIAVSSEHIRKTVSDIGCLKATIADVGLLQPILVRQTDTGYTVIDGARRLKALSELDVQELIIGREVIIENQETEADEVFKQLIANVQREDINDIELGHALVALKERYGYQYKEIAEIIGKTPHYVTAKVGLAKRLTIELQALVVRDQEATKRIRNTSGDQDIEPYTMNINILEDIARLPGELQEAAYEAVKEKEMDKKEALRYLRAIKHNVEALQMADDKKELMRAYSDDGDERLHCTKDVKKYMEKIDESVERLLFTIKTGHIDSEQLAPALELLIGKLNIIYSEVTSRKEDNQAFASSE